MVSFKLTLQRYHFMKALVKCFSKFFKTFRRLFQNAEFLATKRFGASFSAGWCKHVNSKQPPREGCLTTKETIIIDIIIYIYNNPFSSCFPNLSVIAVYCLLVYKSRKSPNTICGNEIIIIFAKESINERNL